MLKRATAAIAVAVTTACAAAGATAAEDVPAGAWRVEAIGGAAVADAVATTLDIDADGTISGSGGCNRYTGKADIGGETIHVGPVASTRMLCPDPAMQQEDAYFDALSRVAGWRRDGAALVLLGDDGQAAVRLVPAVSSATVTFEVPGASGVQRSTVDYRCGAETVRAEYVNAGSVSLALLTIGDEFVVAANVVSASGARYTGGFYEWWSKGMTEATLSDVRKGTDVDCTAEE